MLNFSKDVNRTDIISAGNPMTTTHPTTGSVVETKYFLFNDNAAFRYEAISIDPTDSTTGDGDQSTWIQLAPDNAGSPGTYLAAGAALSMANISDVNVSKPFWVKVTTPSLGAAINRTDLRLTTTFNEFAV